MPYHCPRCQRRVGLLESLGRFSLNPLKYRCRGCSAWLTLGAGPAIGVLLVALGVGVAIGVLTHGEPLAFVLGVLAATVVLHVISWLALPLSVRGDAPVVRYPERHGGSGPDPDGE